MNSKPFILKTSFFYLVSHVQFTHLSKTRAIHVQFTHLSETRAIHVQFPHLSETCIIKGLDR